MAEGITFQHVLIHGDTLLQAIQNHVYSKIAATWTRDNPDCPVLYPSAMILAMVRGLHHAWSQGELTGEQVALRLADLFDRDWDKLAKAPMEGKEYVEAPVDGHRRFRSFGAGPVDRN